MVKVAVDVIGPDDAQVVDGWTIVVSHPDDTEESIDATAGAVELSAAGDHTFTLTAVGADHVLPADGHRAKTVTVAAGASPSATLGGAVVGEDHPVTWHVSAAQGASASGPLINPAAALMALVAVVFWTFVITLDPDTDGLGWPFLLPMGLLGVLMIVAAGAYLLKERPLHVGWLAVIAAFGLAVIVAAAGLTGQISLTEEHRFAIATGGIAIAAFVIGLLRFDTVKAAASLPIVVLFIGLAVWPSGAQGMDADVQRTLIIAMGGILGVSAVGEAAQQVANNVANGRVEAARASVGAQGGAGAGAGAAQPGRSVATPPGDMTRADGR